MFIFYRAHETGESPYPIEYTVNEVVDLLTPTNLPEIDSDELTIKIGLLKNAYFKYCGNLPGCSPPNSDGKIVLLFRGVWEMTDIKTPSCWVLL